jgi:hypothetical protein
VEREPPLVGGVAAELVMRRVLAMPFVGLGLSFLIIGQAIDGKAWW